MTPLAVFAVGLASIITTGCIAVAIAEGYDKLARKFGWPR